MNGEENTILQQISQQIRSLGDDIKETNKSVGDVREDIIRTEERVKNLYTITSEVKADITKLHDKGCAHGKTEEALTKLDISNLKQDTAEIKSELKTKATKADATKLGSAVSAGTSTLLTALIQAVLAIFK